MNRTHFEIKCLRRLKPILRSMYRTSCRRSSSRRRYHGSVAEDAWLDTCQKLLNRWEPHSLSHQAQLREATLQAENADFERAISNCENKIQEKVQEADLLQRKLEDRLPVPKKEMQPPCLKMNILVHQRKDLRRWMLIILVNSLISKGNLKICGMDTINLVPQWEMKPGRNMVAFCGIFMQSSWWRISYSKLYLQI